MVVFRFRPTASAAALAVLVAGCGIGAADGEARASVHRVEVEQCRGNDTQRATAVAVGDGLLATVAHTFENAAKTITVRDPDGSPAEAELVLVDNDRDIALLRVADSTTSNVVLDLPAVGSPVTITTYADADGPEAKEGLIVDLVTATLDGEGRRAAVKLEADIGPGDSGAPLIDRRDRMVGMVFATARSGEIGWAVSSRELIDVLNEFGDGAPSEPSPPCAAA